jgi:hypothetical protein
MLLTYRVVKSQSHHTPSASQSPLPRTQGVGGLTSRLDSGTPTSLASRAFFHTREAGFRKCSRLPRRTFPLPSALKKALSSSSHTSPSLAPAHTCWYYVCLLFIPPQKTDNRENFTHRSLPATWWLSFTPLRYRYSALCS